MNNPETANDVRTYYTAGKIEFDAFDEGFKKEPSTQTTLQST